MALAPPPLGSPDRIAYHFSNLPLDIHNTILELLSPSDVISLRKTCRIMSEATSQRFLWVKMVERICEENTVYLPSFPLDEMSLLDLEYVAMAPKRWEMLAFERRSMEDELLAYSPRIIKQGISVGDDDTMDIYLVPGGRFLVILQPGYLSLWDLGHVSALAADRSKPKEISRMKTGCTSYTVHASADGSALRILAVTYDIPRTRYEVLEIFPWKPFPKFTPIATLSVWSQYSLNFTSVCGDRLTLVYGPIIKIWDFKADAWASWNTAQELHRQILMTTDTIILIDEDDLSVWDVPKLKSNASALSQDFEPDIPVKPRCTIRYPDGYSPPAAFTCKGLCDWYTGSPQPLWYDLLHTSDEGYLHHFDRFEADISDLQNLNGTIKRLPSFELPQVGYVVADSFIMPYRACGQNIVVAWRSRQGVHCHIGSSSSTCPRRGDVTLRLTKSAESSSISFCPVSGRLAYIKATGIEVIDYLWPNDVSRSADEIGSELRV